MSFVHLHVHSHFSLLDGVASPEDLAARAAKLGFAALALTDVVNLYGAVAFYKACKSAKIKPIFGAELHVAPEGKKVDDPRRELGGYHLVALVRDERGYRNLCRLITQAIFEGQHYKPRVDLTDLASCREGLFFLTGGQKGLIGRGLQSGGSAVAESWLTALREVVGAENLLVELCDVGLAEGTDFLPLARQLAKEQGLATVVAHPVHYLDPDQAPLLDVLHAVGNGSSLADPERAATATDQAYLLTEAEVRERFPEDGEAVDRAGWLAEQCNFKMQTGTYHFPAAVPPDPDPDADTDANWAFFYQAFPPPLSFGLGSTRPERPPGAGNLNGYFRWYAEVGLTVRLRAGGLTQVEEYQARLDFELRTIQNMGFPAYLLIVAEFINWAKDNGIPVGPGRGSAAGSLVAWAMRITDIDPIRFELLFERFLNPERVSMPDIDVDFCQDRREEVITHVRDRYGADLVSQIITFGSFKAKLAVRDVARVLDLNFNEADRIAKLVPETLGIKISEAIAQEERLNKLYDGDPKVRRVLEVAMAIEGLPRQTGVHAAGVVISDRPLVDYAPLYRDGPDGGPVVQYDMKSAEEIGLIKFDFLGLKTLDQIRDAVLMIERNHALTLDMSEIPWDDAATYALLQRGDALGVFQLESSGMRELLTRLRPSSMDDMVALVALYRPGPLQSGMVDDYVERKHGRKVVEYLLPILEPTLRPTYGTVIYQEQVMRIAQVMAGYSLGEADLLRRAMGKKKPEEMAKQQHRFVSGAVAQDIAEERAVEIFELLAKFAGYGFNKSHSAAYGFIAYQTAWLKARFRPEFMAALMTIEAANTDKVLQYIQDCRRAGIRVDPVCLNRSERQFSVPPVSARPVENGRRIDSIVFGLAAVKNVGEGAVEALLEARKQAGGRFPSAIDVFERVNPQKVNRRVWESLIKAGAFDFAGEGRAALLAGLEAAMAEGARRQQDRLAGQTSLFQMFRPAAGPARSSFRFPEVTQPLSVQLAMEREVLGLYLSGHPMQAHRKDADRLRLPALSGLHQVRPSEDEDEVRLLVLPVETRVVKTRRGDKMAFVQLEDETGSVEAVFFAEAWLRSQRAIEAGGPVLVTGTLEVGEDSLKLRASSAESLADLRARSTREIRIKLRWEELQGDRLDRFQTALVEGKGSCRAVLWLELQDGWVAEVELPEHPLDPSPELEERLVTLLGRGDALELR